MRNKYKVAFLISLLCIAVASLIFIKFNNTWPGKVLGTTTLNEELEVYINHKTDTSESIGVYFIDLVNGDSFGINEKIRFIPASLLKLPLAMMHYKYSENNPAILATQFKFNKSENSYKQIFKPGEQLVEGNSYSVEELIRHSLIYSDNDAHFLLLNNTNPEELNEIYKKLGLIYPENDMEDIMTAQVYANLFKELYFSSFLNKEYSDKIIGLLKESEFKEGIASGVPVGTVVANKFGERTVVNSQYLHDCGIVYAKRPYVLCVMTKGTDFDHLKKIIQDISRIVYTKKK